MKRLSYLALCGTALSGLMLQACSQQNAGPVESLEAARACEAAPLVVPMAYVEQDEGESRQDYGARVQEAAAAYSETLGQQFDATYDKPEQGEEQSDIAYNAAVSEAFLSANASAECVYTTESGLQIHVNENGPSDAPSPEAGDLVTVHYQGVTLDGEIFDTTYLRDSTETFPSDRVIGGWVEALSLMRKGDNWTLFIPSDLAYDERGAGNVIEPNEALVFNVEMVDVNTPPPPPPPPSMAELSSLVDQARQCEWDAEGEDFTFDAPEQGEDQELAAYNLAVGEAFLAANKERACVVELASGLQMRVLEPVTEGDIRPVPGEPIEFHYEGRLIDGTVFDSSYERGQSMVHASNGFIDGWNEALTQIRVGEKWQLFIPADIAYGAAPRGETIGPNSTLVFDMELIDLPSRNLDGEVEPIEGSEDPEGEQ